MTSQLFWGDEQMSEYKCIYCGRTIETDKRCSCSHCGYTMYELPYERTELLRSEIIRFVDTVTTQDIPIKTIKWEKKEKTNEDAS